MRDKIYCLVCGKGFTTLKKHLAVSHDLTPKEYRKKFKLPAKQALVSDAYAEAKRKIAEQLGLTEGRKKMGRKEPNPAPPPRAKRPAPPPEPPCPTCTLYRAFLEANGQLAAFEVWATTRGWGR